METTQEGPYLTFAEGTAGALTGKEYFVVELDAPENSVKLFSATAGTVAVGALPATSKRQPGDTEVTVRMFGRGGTVKLKQSAAIAKGARLKAVAGGQVATAAAGDRSIGIKLTQGGGAAGDVIEVLDLIETV